MIPDVVPLDMQMDDPKSIYHHYRKWIGLRNKYPDLANGHPEFKNLQNKALLAYTISGKKNTFWVIHNLSDQEVSLPFKDKAEIVSDNTMVQVDDNLVLPGYSSALIRMGR